MKKDKLSFSLVNLFEETQAEVARVQAMVKGCTIPIVGTTWYTTEPKLALIVAGIGLAIDVLLSCIRIEHEQA